MSIEIRPHHLLDILRDYGCGIRCEPHEYGHALHIVSEQVMNNLDQEIVLVVAADDICRPCKHLHADGSCDDTMRAGKETISKQVYNDALDRRLWLYLGLEKGSRMTARDYFHLVRDHLEGIEDVCTHPGEDRLSRREGLIEGLNKLGIGRAE
jgi:hypothetical protein